MDFTDHKIEIESFSWCIFENNVAKKVIDKTLVKEYSTGVPLDIVKFFTTNTLYYGEKINLKLSLNGFRVNAYIERKKDGRHRLNIKNIKNIIQFSTSDIRVNSLWFEKSAEQGNLFYLFVDSNLQNIEETKNTYTISNVKTRIGQHVFKAKLTEKWNNKCAITGVIEHTPSILIASHIKPWAESNNFEKLDENNGLLLSPHFDKLFDTYRITFSHNNELVISKSINSELLKAWNINTKTTIPLSNKQQYYMDYHRHKFEQIDC